MSKEALKILDEIKEHVTECCAITMEPDTVLDLIASFSNPAAIVKVLNTDPSS